MIGFKPIDEFTFDDCAQIVQDSLHDNIPVDDEIRVKYEQLLASLRRQEDRDFAACSTIETYELFIYKYSNLPDASRYKPLHINDARGAIARLRSKRRKLTLGIVAIALAAIAVTIMIGYTPFRVTFQGLSRNSDGIYTLTVDRAGGHVAVPYKSSQPAVELDFYIDGQYRYFDDDSICFYVDPNYEDGTKVRNIYIHGYDRVYDMPLGDEKQELIEIRQPTCNATYIENFPEYAYLRQKRSSKTYEIKTDGLLLLDSTNDNWVDVNITQAGTDRYDLKLSAQSNDNPNRWETINFKVGNQTKSILVKQSGKASYLSLPKESFNIVAEGAGWNDELHNGDPNIASVSHWEVNVNTNGLWKVKNIPYWIKVYCRPADDENGNQFCFIADKNTSSWSRTAVLRIASRYDENIYADFTITQYGQ